MCADCNGVGATAVSGTPGNGCAFAPVASGLLSLPIIGNGVPVLFEDDVEASIRNLGLHLLDRGLLEDGGARIEEIIGEGMRRFIQNEGDGERERLQFDIRVLENRDAGESYVPEGWLCFDLGYDLNRSPEVVLSRLMKIRKKNPALAWLALAILENASYWMPMMTPRGFVEIVEHVEWMGESDESAVVQDMIDGGVGLDEIDVITRKQVMQETPAWACRAGTKKTGRLWGRAIRAARTEEERVILGHLFSIMRLLGDLRYTTKKQEESGKISLENNLMNFTSMLFFREVTVESLQYKVLNDLYRQQMEEGENDRCVRIGMRWDGIREGLEILGMLCRLATECESLLEMVSEEK